MTVQEFLQTESKINLSEVAKAMWPANKTARVYLDKKLRGKRAWTAKDTELAKRVLGQMAVDIQAIS